MGDIFGYSQARFFLDNASIFGPLNVTLLGPATLCSTLICALPTFDGPAFGAL